MNGYVLVLAQRRAAAATPRCSLPAPKQGELHV